VQSLQLVERDKLNLALDELKLSKTKFIDPKNALKLGKGLSARYLLVGGYVVSSETMRLDARLFDVPASKVMFSEKVEGKKDEFFALEKELVELLIKALDVKLQLSEKTKLRSNATESFDAFSKYAAGLTAKDAGDEAKARENFEAALAADPNYRAAKTATARLAAARGWRVVLGYEQRAAAVRTRQIAVYKAAQSIVGDKWSDDDARLCAEYARSHIPLHVRDAVDTGKA
jgi:tetratricopeptide (TPR) repeat protein